LLAIPFKQGGQNQPKNLGKEEKTIASTIKCQIDISDLRELEAKLKSVLALTKETQKALSKLASEKVKIDISLNRDV